jgi:hypothetical protein
MGFLIRQGAMQQQGESQVQEVKCEQRHFWALEDANIFRAPLPVPYPVTTTVGRSSMTHLRQG